MNIEWDEVPFRMRLREKITMIVFFTGLGSVIGFAAFLMVRGFNAVWP